MSDSGRWLCANTLRGVEAKDLTPQLLGRFRGHLVKDFDSLAKDVEHGAELATRAVGTAERAMHAVTEQEKRLEIITKQH